MNLSKLGDGLSPCGVLELASVLGEVRNMARFSLSVSAASRLVSALAESELVALPQRIYTHVMRADSDGNIYYSLSHERIALGDEQIVYVTHRRKRKLADALYELEVGRGSSAEVGRMLGYPACCCERYDEIAQGRDWLEVMLENTPDGATTYASCNRCARVFGEWGVLPDYFPCSFCCIESNRLAKAMDNAGRVAGLSEYLERTWTELSTPIQIDGESIERQSTVPQRESRRTKCSPRRLTWT